MDIKKHHIMLRSYFLPKSLGLIILMKIYCAVNISFQGFSLKLMLYQFQSSAEIAIS